MVRATPGFDACDTLLPLEQPRSPKKRSNLFSPISYLQSLHGCQCDDEDECVVLEER